MLDKTDPVRTDTGETSPCIGELPDFYKCTRYAAEDVTLGLSVLTRAVRDMNEAHTNRQAVSFKVAVENVAKVANQLQIMAAHLARKTTEHVNRKART